MARWGVLLFDDDFHTAKGPVRGLRRFFVGPSNYRVGRGTGRGFRGGLIFGHRRPAGQHHAIGPTRTSDELCVMLGTGQGGACLMPGRKNRGQPNAGAALAVVAWYGDGALGLVREDCGHQL